MVVLVFFGFLGFLISILLAILIKWVGAKLSDRFPQWHWPVEIASDLAAIGVCVLYAQLFHYYYL